jgi:hypothetical protein
VVLSSTPGLFHLTKLSSLGPYHLYLCINRYWKRGKGLLHANYWTLKDFHQVLHNDISDQIRDPRYTRVDRVFRAANDLAAFRRRGDRDGVRGFGNVRAQFGSGLQVQFELRFPARESET